MALIGERFDPLSDLSVHGLHQIGRLQGITKRKALFWVVIFIAATTVLCLQVRNLATYVQTYPTVVRRKISRGPIAFPTVTFCSMGVVKKSVGSKIPVFKQMQKSMNQWSTKTTRKKRNSILGITQLTTQPEPEPVTHVSEVEIRVDNITEPNAEWSHIEQIGEEQLQTANSSVDCANETAETNVTGLEPLGNMKVLATEGQSTTTEVMLLPVTVEISKSSKVIRTKRSIAESHCDNWACYLTPIWTVAILNDSVNTSAGCVTACGSLGSVSYSHWISLCECYSADCCTSVYKFAQIFAGHTCAIIGYCDDFFSSTVGTASPKPPYYQNLNVSYTCPSGYLNPNSLTTTVYTCQSTGIWFPPFRPCLAVCPNIFDLTTGSIVSPNAAHVYYFAGQSYVFTCAYGYLTPTNLPSETYTCTGGFWYKPFSSCIAPCENIFDLTTGSIAAANAINTYSSGSYVFTCLPGYLTPSKALSQSYICSGSQWDKTFTSCIAPCPDMFTYTTGSISPVAPFLYGSSYTFTCLPNYFTVSMMTSQPYTCGNSGIWDRSFTPCYPVCANIFDSTGTTGTPPPFVGFPTTYTFSCIAAYLLPNYATTQQYTCQTDGTWNPAIFTPCLKECPVVKRTQSAMVISYNGPIVQNLIPSGVVATFSCVADYVISGTYQVSQCYKGSWDIVPSQYPICLAPCNAIDPVTLYPHLQVNYNHTGPLIHGTLASFYCNNSYFIYGDYLNTTCNNGTWNLSFLDYPICLEQQIAYYDAKTIGSYADPSAQTDCFANGAAMVDMMSYIMANLSASMKSSMGFSRDDSLVSCTYDNRSCDKSVEIVGFNDNSVGNCYSFNHKYLNDSLMVEEVGEQSGLYWIFNSQQDEFMSMIPTGGIQLIIHQPFEPIFPNSMGIAVSPGFTYTIALERKREVRLETPRSLCFNDPLRAKYYYVENTTYAIEACQRSFYQSQIVELCGCASPQLPSQSLGKPLCSLENRTCVNNVINNSTFEQSCPPPCLDVVEDMVVTVSSNAQNSQLYKPFKFTKAYAQSNLLSVKIFYETTDVFDYVEEISYSIINCITDVGSSMGMLAGMSVVSLIEIIFTAVRICLTKQQTP